MNILIILIIVVVVWIVINDLNFVLVHMKFPQQNNIVKYVVIYFVFQIYFLVLSGWKMAWTTGIYIYDWCIL
jgi:hypothetical protein